MKSLREDSPPGGARYRLSYTRASQMDDGKPCRVYCEESEADEAILEINHIEFRYHRDQRHPKLWDYGLDQLLRALQAAFTQGVSHQKVVIRDTLREVIGV